jgi:hypothetical protein
MVGAGFGAFSVMGYVIANMKPDKTVGFQVELNTKLLSAVFGEPEETIQKAIEFLCAPDPQSRTPTESGRRLAKVGQFAYRVVNGVLYDRLRNEEDRREQNRIAQQRHRQKKPTLSKSQVRAQSELRERRFVEADKNGETARADAIAAEGLP